MALTRVKVAKQMGDLAEVMEGAGIPTLYRDGGEIDERAIDNAYRDVRRCIFCSKRSEIMSLGMAMIEAPVSIAIGGPNMRHARALLYGLCRAHTRLAENDPEYWTGKLDEALKEGLKARIEQTAQSN